MKKYCIEYWYFDPNDRFRDGSFWGTIETPWKIGMTDIVEEYDNEEEFKQRLLDIINECGIIGKVQIREEWE